MQMIYLVVATSLMRDKDSVSECLATPVVWNGIWEPISIQQHPEYSGNIPTTWWGLGETGKVPHKNLWGNRGAIALVGECWPPGQLLQHVLIRPVAGQLPESEQGRKAL